MLSHHGLGITLISCVLGDSVAWYTGAFQRLTKSYVFSFMTISVFNSSRSVCCKPRKELCALSLHSFHSFCMTPGKRLSDPRELTADLRHSLRPGRSRMSACTVVQTVET